MIKCRELFTAAIFATAILIVSGQPQTGYHYPVPDNTGVPSESLPFATFTAEENNSLSQERKVAVAAAGTVKATASAASAQVLDSDHGHGHHHHDSDDPLAWLRDAIPGEPGVDYPIFNVPPTTSFTCEEKVNGLYADVDARCQVWHQCYRKEKWSFLCPNGTIFDQQIFTCVWWFNADCSTSEAFYVLNEELYKNTVEEKVQSETNTIPRRPIGNFPIQGTLPAAGPTRPSIPAGPLTPTQTPARAETFKPVPLPDFRATERPRPRPNVPAITPTGRPSGRFPPRRERPLAPTVSRPPPSVPSGTSPGRPFTPGIQSTQTTPGGQRFPAQIVTTQRPPQRPTTRPTAPPRRRPTSQATPRRRPTLPATPRRRPTSPETPRPIPTLRPTLRPTSRSTLRPTARPATKLTQSPTLRPNLPVVSVQTEFPSPTTSQVIRSTPNPTRAQEPVPQPDEPRRPIIVEFPTTYAPGTVREESESSIPPVAEPGVTPGSLPTVSRELDIQEGIPAAASSTVQAVPATHPTSPPRPGASINKDYDDAEQKGYSYEVPSNPLTFPTKN